MVSVSDSIFKSSAVGITVAHRCEWSNVEWAKDMRSNFSLVTEAKSVNGGKTHKAGLDKADAIGNIEVHPTDANIVFVAAMGNPFKSNPERGVPITRWWKNGN
jgi:hypothetical protein